VNDGSMVTLASADSDVPTKTSSFLAIYNVIETNC